MSVIKSIAKKIRYCLLYIRYYYKFASVASDAVIFRPTKLLNVKHVDIGSKSYILEGLRLECIEQYNDQHFTPHISIGKGVEIGQGVQISCASEIIIEDHVGIGPYCMINDVTHGHEGTGEAYLLQDIKTKPIRIGEGTMLGHGVIVLPGVTIGKYCMIGANAIISKDIPDYTLVVNHSQLEYRDLRK